MAKAAPRKAAAPKPAGLDLSAFPPESLSRSEHWICLACVLDVFTRHLGLARSTAYKEVSGYVPSVEELKTVAPARPYFTPGDAKDPCPNCGSAVKWHARLIVDRIESGKSTDAPRRQLVKSFPKNGAPFAVLEEKVTCQHAFFDWLEKISAGLDLEDPRWLRDVSLHYVSRKEPKTDWETPFAACHSIRRSRRIEQGWELDQGRLFLAPMLFDELLAVQYLISRSHKAGGLTLEGRYTLPELFLRLRTSGYLRFAGITAHGHSDALEQLLEYLSGGEASLKFYYIVDRRDLIEKAKAVKLVRPPKPKVSG